MALLIGKGISFLFEAEIRVRRVKRHNSTNTDNNSHLK